MVNLGKLEEITDLRTVWPHEALDFTPWLTQDDNITLLADAVGLDITVEETESSVGDFNVDIFASETGTNRKIIIENQLEDTNHDHLGKLITYASGKAAEVVIWVVRHAREEHRAAIEWLNNHTDEQIGFFLCEIKLNRIGNSEPAVKFEILEKPNDWSKGVKKQVFSSGSQQERYDYWAAFQDYAFQNAAFSKEFKRKKTTADSSLSYPVGSSEYCISIAQIRNRDEINVCFYIWDNKPIYQTLFQQKDAVEHETGLTFSWCGMPGRKASKILAVHTAALSDRSQWDAQFSWLMKAMLDMKTVFKKHL